MSPRQTRSAKKKKRAPLHQEGFMNISPPNHELNEKIQKEEIQAKEEAR